MVLCGAFALREGLFDREREMDLKGSKTEKNLEAALADESRAQNTYGYYADAAQKAGHHYIADVFLASFKRAAFMPGRSS